MAPTRSSAKEGGKGKKPLTQAERSSNFTVSGDESARPKFMEDETFYIPYLNEGVVGLGDLWNCRTSAAVGNLFDKELEAVHLEANAIEAQDYWLDYVGDTMGAVNNLNVSASLKCEITLGEVYVKVSGSAEYDSKDSTKFDEQNIRVNYEVVTHQVRLRPTARNVISRLVRKHIDEDVIKATHYVEAVVLGGNAVGKLRYSEKVSSSNLLIKGSLDVDIKVTELITISAQASLELLDTEHSESYNTRVSVKAQPRLKKSPTNVKEMFAEIEKLDEYTNEQQHFPQLNPRIVCGVPVGFRLVPIYRIMDEYELEEGEGPVGGGPPGGPVPVLPPRVEEPTYQLLPKDLLEEYTSMMATLQDFINPEYTKALICRKKSSLAYILRDEENPMTKDLREWSLELIQLAKEIKMDAVEVYTLYKLGIRTEKDVRDMIGEYDRRFEVLKKMDIIQQYVVRGKNELNGIRASDVVDLTDEWDKPSVNFFSSVVDLEEWYNPERTIKILLRTNQDNGSPSGVFLKLFDMSATLQRHGVEVGVAFPEISNGEFSLTFKSSKKTTVYSRDEIPFVLEVLGVAVDEGDNISTLFYSLNACLSGLYLPMVEHLDDIPSLVTVMEDYRGTKICETYVQLLASLLETDDTWNFVLPVQALHTGVEMMRFYRQLRKSLPERFPGLKVRWIMSKVNGTNHFDSPLMFVFKDDVCKGVCLDQLEMLILLEQLGRPSPDLSLISYKRMKESCFYTPRVDFATDIIQNLILDHPTWISDPVEPWTAYGDNPDLALPEAMAFMREACQRDEPSILACVANQAISITPELENVLAPFGWKDKGFQRVQWKKNDWSDLLKMLKAVLNTSAPFLIKVAGSLDELSKISLKYVEEDEEEDEDKEDEVKVNEEEEDEDKEDEDKPKPPAQGMTEAEIGIKLEEIVAFLKQDGTVRRFLTYKWRGLDINEDDVFRDLKAEIYSYDSLPTMSKKMAYTAAFQSFYDNKIREEPYFYMVNLITLVEGLTNTGKEANYPTFKHLLPSLAKKYCAQLAINDHSEEIADVDARAVAISTEEYPNAWRKIKEALARRQLFKVLDLLAQVRYHPLLYLIHQELFNLTALPSPTTVKSIIDKLAFTALGYFEDGRLEVIWNNPKFLYLVRQSLENEGVLSSLYVFISTYNIHLREAERLGLQGEPEQHPLITPDDEEVDLDDIKFPTCIPSDIVERVKPMFAIRTGPQFNWLRDWENLDMMIETFQIIATRQQLPLEFLGTLRENIETRTSIQVFMKEAGCLYYWNKDSYFEHPWSVLTVRKCLDVLLRSLEAENSKKTLESFPGIIPIKSTKSSVLEAVRVNNNWKRFTKDGTLPPITTLTFLMLEKLRPLEIIEYDDLSSACDFILPYVVQQAKMFTSWILRPSVVSKFINYRLAGARPGQLDLGDGIPNRNLGLLMSRSDIVAGVLWTAEPFVVHRILDAMVQGPIALPLIIPDVKHKDPPLSADPKVKETVNKEGGTVSKLLFPSLQSLIVPEMEALVPQPHLFQTPFRFVVTLRVGDTTPDPGRSSLINELLMRDQNMFSCWNEPGKAAGKSLGRNGLLEFTWLSPTTCEESFWTSTVLPEYQSQRKEMILLGNLHGDATQFESLFEILKPLVSSYVVFWKASNLTDLKAKKKQLTQMMAAVGKTQVLDVVLYPDSSIAQQVHEQNLLLKGEDSSMSSLNRAKLQRIFKEAIRNSVRLEHTASANAAKDSTNIGPVPTTPPGLFSFASLGGKAPKSPGALPIDIQIQNQLATVESLTLSRFVQHHTIESIKRTFKEGKGTPVEEFFETFKQLLSLPLQSRLNSLLHFQYELDFLSRKTRKETFDRVTTLRSQITKEFRKVGNPEERWVLETQDEIKMYLEELQLETMSMQDIFRAFCSPINPEWTDQRRITGLYFEYFINGFPIELLHSTYGQGMFERPVKTFFKDIAGLRVFVISIAGLKGSGKSTLLNRLFGQGFTENSSTFGLQGRLLELDDELSWELNCDVFLLIDSEGVGAPENKVDAGADAWERRLVTFLLGVCDLTLVNCLGSEMEEMGPILQVSLTGLSKLDQVAVQPDIFIVNQQQAGEVGLLDMEFSRLLQETKTFSQSREFATGIRVREAHRLKALKSRLKHGEIIQTIRPLGSPNEQGSTYENYHQDVQRLYQTILKKCHQTKRTRQTVGSWYKFTEKFWNEIQSLDFPFQHPNIKSMEEGLDFDDQVAKVKQAIADAFHVHEKRIDERFKDYVETVFPGGADKKPDAANVESEIQLFMGPEVDSKLKSVINACTLNAPSEVGDTRAMTMRTRRFRTAAATSITPDTCTPCARAYTLREALFAQLKGRKRGFLIEDQIRIHASEVRESIFQKFEQSFTARQITEGKFATSILKPLQEIPKNDSKRWEKAVQFVSTKQTVIPARGRVDDEIQEVYKSLGHVTSKHSTQGAYEFPHLNTIAAFDVDQYNAAVESSMNSPKQEKINWMQHDWLVTKLEDIPPKMFQDYDTKIFKIGMTYEFQQRAQRLLELFEEYCGEKLLPDFMWEAHLYGIMVFSQYVDGKQEVWDADHNPLQIILEKGKDDFFKDLDEYPIL